MQEELTDGKGQFERWVGLPTKPGQRLHGLARAHIYLLIQEGKIKTANLKRAGCLTGRRLIWEKSLVEYINSFAEGGCP